MPRPPSKAVDLAEQLAVKIAAGEYQTNQWLPSRRDLGAQFGVDRGTVGRALHILDERGLVTVVEGNGARVASRVVARHEPHDMTQDVGRWRGFGAATSRAGAEPYTDVLSVGEVPTSPQVARNLGVPVGTVALERVRVHGIHEAETRRPVEIASTWITAAVIERVPVLRREDTGPGGMTARLTEAGYELRYEDVISARLADPRERDLLGIDDRQPVLDVWRRTYDQTDHVIKASRRVINPLLHELVSRYP